MSKTLDLLRVAEEQRKGNYSLLLNKQANQPLTQKKTDSRISKTHAPWVISLVLLTLLLSLLGLNLKLFLIIKDGAAKRNNMLTKLDKVEELMNKNMHQIKVFSADVENIGNNLDKIDTKVQSNDTKIAKLEKKNGKDIETVENMAKANDALPKRINSLEIEIEKLKVNNSLANNLNTQINSIDKKL